MTVAVAVVAAATTTGNQDITTTDLAGATPKAVIFLYSRAAADGTINTDGGVSIGMTDGTNQIAVGAYKQHGLTLWSNSLGMAKVGKTDKCITALYLDGTIKVHSEAAFVSFIANGVRVNWTTMEEPDGWLVTALFFSGSNWTVEAGNASLATTPGTTVTTGFQPDAVFLLGANDAFPGTITTNWFQTTFGVTTWKGGSIASSHLTTAGASSNQNIDWNSTVSGQGAGRFQTGVGGVYTITVARSATGFSVATGSSPGTDKIGYLALRYGGSGELTTGKISIASEATGDQSFTGFGGEPAQFLLMLMAQHTAVNRIDWRFGAYAHTETKGGGFAVGGRADGTVVSGTNPTAQHSVASVDKVRMLNDAGTENARCTVASYDSDGITLNFSVAPDLRPELGTQTATWEWLYLTIVNDSGGGGGGGSGRSFGWVID